MSTALACTMSRVRAHLSEVWRWSVGEKTEAAEVAAAALGMAAPLLLALLNGKLGPGLAAATGALAVGRVKIAAGFRVHLRHEVEALVPASFAALLAVLTAGHGWQTSAALVLLSGLAAIISGFSRMMAVATTRFILFLMIVSAVATPMRALGAREAIGFLVLAAGGALWTSALSLVLGGIVRRRRGVAVLASPSQPGPTFRQKYTRWRRSLTSVAGWSYPIRLAGCLGLASAIDLAWPSHHFHWIIMAVALLTQRQAELLSVKTTQRAFGTAIGVAIAGLTLRAEIPAWTLAGIVGILAGGRPLLRDGSYLAYSAVMTPLIILLMDAGRPPNSDVLLDRLAATLIGASLILGANLAYLRLVSDRRPIQ